MRQQRVTGGVSVTFDSFASQGMILLSGEPAVTAHMQTQLQAQVPAEVASTRALAAHGLAAAADLVGRLPAVAFSGPPPVATVPMLTEAGRLAAAGESLVAADPIRALGPLRKAAAITGQFERRVWENAVKAEGSMMANPLVASDAALGEAWQFIAARTTTVAGEELLAGGDMERIESLAGDGWRHFARTDPDIVTSVEVLHSQAASGRGCLKLAARAKAPEESPIVVETPPLWITTPPVAAPAGKLLEISAQVWVPSPITGSVDGLLVFDSLGGPALAERVGATAGWRRMTLYRIVPPEAAGEPLVVTFALSGLGEARIDDVSVRVLERAGAGTPTTLVSTGGEPGGEPAAGSFPSPADLLTPRPAQPATAPATQPAAPPPTAAAAQPATAPATAWPGTNLGWPKLLGGSANEPPPGPGGGTIDPFKRARGS